jgi:hypothetical protein
MIGGINMIVIHGNGAMRIIIVIEHLRNNVKRPKILFYCIFQNNITYEEDVMLNTKCNLFFICIIGSHVGTIFAYIVNPIMEILTIRIIY